MTKKDHEAMTFLANKMLFLGGAFAVACVIAICSGTSNWLTNICAGGTILMAIPGIIVRQFLAGVEIEEDPEEEDAAVREAFLGGKAFDFWKDPEEDVYEDVTLDEHDPGASNPHSV